MKTMTVIEARSQLAKALNRSPLYVGRLQKRFELPVLKGTAYSPAYLAFLQADVALRTRALRCATSVAAASQ